MRLRWDWLGPLVTVPFVPTIGPVHPDEVGPGLFSDVISVAGTDRFLEYDKDRRWFDAKAESVLVDDIIHRQHETWLPVLSRRGAGSVTVYVYGKSPDDHLQDRGLRSLGLVCRLTVGAPITANAMS